MPEPAPTYSTAALKAAAEYRQQSLAGLTRPLIKVGIEVDCVATWDFPAHDAIVRHLSEQLALLAAVAPLHSHAKPSQLDDRIISQAVTVIDQLGGSLKLAHAFTAPLSNSDATFIEPLRIPIKPDRARRFVAGITAQVLQLARRHRIAPSQCLVKEGDAVTTISALASKHKTDLLVMGAVSRRELRRPFIGNTAENLIDKLHCDLLIIKPASFKSSVPRQSAAAKLRI